MDTGWPTSLASGWELSCPSRRVATPCQLPGTDAWVPAPVPGTAAQALCDAGLWDPGQPAPLHDRDVWYRVALPACGRRILRFDGLATVAEAWLDGSCVIRSASMFCAQEAAVDINRPLTLHVCFRSLFKALDAVPQRRGRWRTPMIPDARLRQLRTTLLGHMPGWCPPMHAIGPYRPVWLLDPDGPPAPAHVVLHTRLDREGGHVRARVTWASQPGVARLRVAGAEVTLRRIAPGVLEGEMAVPGATPWWPATHGVPQLHPASLLWDAAELPLAPVGFRNVAIDRGLDQTGFTLRVNGVPVFCRGAVWTSAGLISLPEGEAACLPWLEAARDAGMNLIRVPGAGVYESDAFYSACDRLGLLVWQDFAFANLDYPTDPAFLATVAAEARGFLNRTSGRAYLAVLCGASEVAQQAAMLGLPRAAWEGSPLFGDLLPRLCAELRPDVPYVPHTPAGPDVPFRPDGAPAHYFGAGAYLRPPEDARAAGVRFASECLALANVPCTATLDASAVLSVQGSQWKARLPRDLGASWDFEDVRDHYLESLFGQDARLLRREDLKRYLMLSRAVSGTLMAEVFTQWRRAGSLCSGGVVLALQDLWPGAGWGILDSLGRPKAAWHALRAVLAPVQVLLLDEGLNGVQVHLLNDTAEPVAGSLELAWFRNGHLASAPAVRQVSAAPRSASALSAAELIGGFRDLANAYRFGPPPADAVRARFAGEDARLATEHWLFPDRLLPRAALGLRADLEQAGPEWRLSVRAEHVAQGVHLNDPAWRADTEWFHLGPGETRHLRLIPLDASDPHPPEGGVVALNGLFVAHYSASEPAVKD